MAGNPLPLGNEGQVAPGHEQTASAVFSTLGAVIDGYLRLSPSEKGIFQAAMGLMEKTPTSVSVAPNATTTTAPVAVNVVPAGTTIPPGHTRDPKTGKVFKLTARREHTAERIRLESSLEESKKAFSAFIRSNRIVKDKDGNPCLENPERVLNDEGVPLDKNKPEFLGLDAVKSAEFNRLKRAVEESKGLREQYKAAHPEEFTPPPNKKKGKFPSNGVTTPSASSEAT